MKTIKTQSVKYAGSKLKLLPAILDLIPDNVNTVLDGFSGSTRVSQALAYSGYTVTSNDVSPLSEVLATCYLQPTSSPTTCYLQSPSNNHQELISHLNALQPVDGWFTANYGGYADTKSSVQPDGLKRIWQRHNTKKLDAIRTEIDNLNLDNVTKSVALTSLILAMDAVDSSLGHQVSYLKEWSSRSYKDAILRVPDIKLTDKQHTVIKGDVFDAIGKHHNLAYFDSPYGSSNAKMPSSRIRYDSYYHIWKTIVLNDKPELFGKAKRRVDSRDNFDCPFEDYRGTYAIDAMRKLVTNVNAEYVIVSYNNNGIITLDTMLEILNNNGKLLKTVVVDYKRNVMSAMNWTKEWVNQENNNQEYLFLLEKT
jgi:adenine-specific DNA-methyltransferase